MDETTPPRSKDEPQGASTPVAVGLWGKLLHAFSAATHETMARRTAMLSFGVRVISAAIAYLAQILIARWLGNFEYGVYVSVWTMVLILGNSGSLGFSSAASRFIPDHAASNPDLLRGFLRTSRLFAVGFPLITGLVGIGGIFLLGEHLQSHYVWPLYLAFVCLPFFSLSETQDHIARCYNAPLIALGPNYILRPLLILGLMVAAYLAGITTNAATAMVCAIAASAIACAVQAALLHRRLKASVPAGLRSYDIRRWLPYALPLFCVDGLVTILENVDVLLLAYLTRPENVGVYFAVTKTLVLGAFVSFAVRAATAHRFSEYHVAGDRERLQAFVTRTAVWTFWPTLAAILVMIALGRPFLSLFGPAFLEGYPLLFVLSFGLVVRSTIGPAERLLAMLDEPGLVVRITLIELAFAVAAHVVLISLFGIMGAAIAAALMLLCETALLAHAVHTRLGLRVGFWAAYRSGPAR